MSVHEGSFTIITGEGRSDPVPYDASNAEVQAAFNQAAERATNHARFELFIVGTDGRYPISLRQGIEQAADVLSDLTGYKVERLREMLLDFDVDFESTEIGGSALECSCAPLRILVKRVA